MSDRVVSAKALSFKPVGPVFASPWEWRDQFFYHLLIDRFSVADDDRPACDFDRTDTPPPRPDDGRGVRFQGGNIRGITQRLDYIKGLGATAIWISPPFKNRQEDETCYHGYGIQDFLAVDPRFGTLEDLQELVREAHARGLYVVIDIVINHSGDNWAYPGGEDLLYNETGRYDFGYWRARDGGPVQGEPGPDDAVWPVELQNPDAYQRRGRIRDMGGASLEEAVKGDFVAYKDFALEDHPETLDTLIRCYKWWIAQTDCDGYRIDTVKHIEPTPTAIFCNAIREYALSIGKNNFMIFGEVVGDDALLEKYVASNLPVAGEEAHRYPRLDACLDFPLYFDLEEVLKGDRSPQVIEDRYESFRRLYRDYGSVGEYFVTFVDNHDQMHRPYRRFLHGVEDDRLAILAMGYLLTGMGIPCIYYGTEQGFDGGGPHDTCVRESMFGGGWGAFGRDDCHFFRPEHRVYRGIARLAAIRAAEPVLRYGRQYFREISSDGVNFGRPIDGKCTFAFCRILDDQTICVAMNLDHADRSDYMSVDDKFVPPGTVLVDLLEDKSYEVIRTESGVPCVHIPLRRYQIAVLKIASTP